MTLANLKIITYLVLTVFIVIGLNYYIASSDIYSKAYKIDANYKLLKRYEDASSLGKDIQLIIGNSYVASSFADDDQNNTILFTVAGMQLIDMLGVIENLPVDTKVSNIVIGLGYNYASPSSGSSTFYSKYYAGNAIAKLWYSIPLVRGYSSTSSIIKEDVNCLFSQLSSGVKCNKDEAIERENSKSLNSKIGLNKSPPEQKALLHSKNLQKSVEKRYNEYKSTTKSVSGRFRVYLERIESESKKRNINIFAYTAPIYRGLYDKLEGKFLKEFHSTIEQTGIRYVDLNQVFTSLSSKDFSDATHIAKNETRKITTQYLRAYFELKN